MDLDEYYARQSGTGFGYPVFVGREFQKGNNFLGSFLRGTIWPLLKKVAPYLKDKAIETGSAMFSDIKEGKSFKQSAKDRLEDAAINIGMDGLVKVKNRRRKTQSGTGLRRRRRRRVRKSVVPKTIKRKPRKRRTVKRRKRKTKHTTNLLF